MGFFDKIGFTKPKNNLENKPTQEKAPSFAWGKFMTLFLAGSLSVEALSAATATLTPVEKEAAKEYLKSSPTNVKKLEKSILEKARDYPAVDDGVENGTKKSHKNFELSDGMAVWIEYKNDIAVSFSLRGFNEKGTKVIVADGYGDEAMDGRVDHVRLFDSNGKETHSYGFKETTDEKGETVVQLTGISVTGEGESSTAFAMAQGTFQEKLASVAETPQVNF